VTSLVVMTAWAGYYMGAAKSGVSSLTWTLLNALIGIGITCAGSAALNEVLEHKIDALMRRTRNRPLPAGRMSLATGLTAGILATILGPLYLSLTTNILTGVLALSTAATYLTFYTPLKRISPISTFVGAFPGAMPPLLGWTAIRGKLEIEAVFLFLIVFFWQFPHFQAIAWMYREDYEAAGIKMLPVVDKAGHSVIRQMFTYCSTLISVSLVPTLLRMTGKIYLFGALVLGLGFLWFVFRLARTKLPTTSPDSRLFARQLLQASVVYLPLLFALMMLNVVHS
jgi:protoheme IX farnesyltransferase